MKINGNCRVSVGMWSSRFRNDTMEIMLKLYTFLLVESQIEILTQFGQIPSWIDFWLNVKQFKGCIALPNVWSLICLCSAGNLSFKFSILKKSHFNFYCVLEFLVMVQIRYIIYRWYVCVFYKQDKYMSFKLAIIKQGRKPHMKMNTILYK